MHRRNGQWIQIAPSYIQDKLQREDEEGELFQLDTYRDNLGIIRVRIFSRFRNATKHQLWIAYIGPGSVSFHAATKFGVRRCCEINAAKSQ